MTLTEASTGHRAKPVPVTPLLTIRRLAVVPLELGLRKRGSHYYSVVQERNDGMKRTGKAGSGWSVVRGCAGLYRLPGGRMWVRFQAGGQVVSEGVPRGLSVGEAREFVRERRRLVGRRLAGIRDNGVELSRLREDWLRWIGRRLKVSTVRGYRAGVGRILGWLREEAGVTRADGLSLVVLERYVEARKCGMVRDRTINVEVDALRRMIKWGVEVWGVLRSDPTVGWKRLPEWDKRVRRPFEEGEFERMVSHRHRVNGGGIGRPGTTQPCRRRDVWRMLGDTGMRVGELGALVWGDVDFAGGAVRVRAGKTRAAARWIPLTGACLELLARRAWRDGLAGLGRGREGLAGVRVFRTSRGGAVTNNLWSSLQRCFEAAGVNHKGLCLHSFRHFFASRLLRAGVSPKTVQELLGHSTAAMVMAVYGHVLEGDEARAIDAMERRPDGAAWVGDFGSSVNVASMGAGNA